MTIVVSEPSSTAKKRYDSVVTSVAESPSTSDSVSSWSSTTSGTPS